MKPVDQASLDGILKKKSILMLNQAKLEESYIEFLVKRNPDNVKSKNGIPLPLELWFEIFKLASFEPVYCLVQPQSIRQGDRGPELICHKIPERKLCCDIKDDRGLWAYESYLDEPYEQLTHNDNDNGDEEEIPRPFQLPNPDGQTEIVVRLSSQNFQLDSLFHDATVPDVIAKLENQARCRACRGAIWVAAESPRGMRVTTRYVGYWATAWGDVLCPLCIGVDECKHCMSRNRELADYGDYPDSDDDNQDDVDHSEFEEIWGTREEHESWVQGRLEELGYC